MSYRRNAEDLSLVIKHAKLDGKSITKVAQAIYYPNLNTSNLKLLELEEDMIEELEKGNPLIFKGGLSEKVVLCTRSRTYEIKNAEQSNSLLIIPELLSAEKTNDSPLKSPVGDNINKSLDRSLEDEEMESSQDPPILHEIQHKQILKICYSYMEPREIMPPVKRIQELLNLTRYNGPENEEEIERKYLFTRRQLFEAVQSSATQFDDCLRKIRCIKIDGFMRVLDCRYEYHVVTLLTSMINENSWNLDQVDKEESLTALEDIIPRGVLESIFDLYTEQCAETGKYRYKEDMVCRIIAMNVLQENLKFHIEEFIETCKGALPEGMEFDEAHLAGIGIIDRESQIPSVRGLFEYNLPMNLNERLIVLFKLKEKWTLPQIAPYIEVFTTPKLTVTNLLAKYTRSVTENGIRYYQSKHK